MAQSLFDILSRKSATTLLLLSTGLVFAIGFVDYITGPELSLSIFYILPIFLAAWFINRTAGYLISILSASALLILELINPMNYSNPAAPYWNAIMRLGFFLIFTYVLSLGKEAEISVKEANEKLSKGIEDLEQHNHQVTLLGEMADLLHSCSEISEAYPVVASAAEKCFPDFSGSICIINPSRNTAEVVQTWRNFYGASVFTPSDCWAIRRGRMHLIDSSHSLPACPHLESSHYRLTLCVPLVAHGEAFGILHFQQKSDVDVVLDESRQKLIIAMAEQTALAISNLKLRDTLRGQAIRDPLTGLFNRRYLEESFDRELLHARRNATSIGFILIDVDHFKNFNDNFGHEAGDVILQEIAKALRNGIRGGDVACRYGGEEFVVMLLESAVFGAEKRAQQLRERVSELNVQFHGQRLDQITISLGVAGYPEHGENPEAILRAADAALYRAKTSGRNCVVVAGDLSPQP